MTVRRRTFLSLGLALPVLAGCATGDSDVPETDGTKITVGLVAPQSGFSANYGPEARRGVDLALEQAGHRVGDLKIELVSADEDVLDPSQTLERVKKLIESDGANVVIGPVFGSSQQAVAPYLTQRGIPMFSFLGAESALAREGSAFIWPGADEYTAGPLGTYAAQDLGYRSIATLAPDYAYGRNVIEGVAAAFTAAGGAVTQRQWVPLGTTDMLQYATGLDAGVDALVVWLVPADAAAFVREYRNLGVAVPLLLHQGVFDPTYQEIGAQLIGEKGLTEYNFLLDNGANTEFVASYRQRHDAVPNQTEAFAFAVTNIVLEGLRASGGNPAVDALRAALNGATLRTVIGEATYSADGIASSDRTVVASERDVDGRFVWRPVKTYAAIGTGGKP